MKKFLILEKGSFSGFISTNLSHPVWGVNPKSKRSEMLESIFEDFGNVQLSFPKSPDDDLTNPELVAYYKLQVKLNDANLVQAHQLKLQFGDHNAKI